MTFACGNVSRTEMAILCRHNLGKCRIWDPMAEHLRAGYFIATEPRTCLAETSISDQLTRRSKMPDESTVFLGLAPIPRMALPNTL